MVIDQTKKILLGSEVKMFVKNVVFIVITTLRILTVSEYDFLKIDKNHFLLP